MINKFIKKILNIENYNLHKYNSWKDNITYEVDLGSWESFIIQQVLVEKTNKNIEFIEKIISFIENDSNINFANNYLEKRFIAYEWSLFQIMKKINWITIEEKDINIEIIKNTAEYIALFHNKINEFNWEKYEEINYYKKMNNYRLEVEKLLKNNSNPEVKNLFLKMNKIAINLKENKNLPKWVIHWDPSFKNFLINNNKKIVWLIDYDMLSVNNYIWDLADLIRSYMKIKVFNKKEFNILINSYNNVRKLTDEENKELKNYCTMMILDTWFRYLLNYFNSSNHNNLLWDKENSFKKANRCLLEVEKLNTFYN